MIILGTILFNACFTVLAGEEGMLISYGFIENEIDLMMCWNNRRDELNSIKVKFELLRCMLPSGSSSIFNKRNE